jgi:AcrR family transcriptional regulator
MPQSATAQATTEGTKAIAADQDTERAARRPGVVSRTGPKRSESIRLAVLNAADDLLVEQGFNAMTIEGIATRAGVAKQTIYRWWKSKVDILLDTLTDDAEEALAWRAGAASAEQELEQQLRHVADFFQQPAGQVLVALIGHAQFDPDTARKLRDGFLREQRERDLAGLNALLQRHTGRTVGERVAGRLLDIALGPLHHQALVLGGPIDMDIIPITARLVLDEAARSIQG